MASATHKLANQTLIDKKGVKENADLLNPEAFRGNPNLVRPADYFIYIFNTGAMKHVVDRPPMFLKVNIPACNKGERYRIAFKLPNICHQTWPDPDTGTPRVHSEYGERVAMDMINPNNLGVDQDAEIDPSTVFSAGNDLSVFGVFWSRNETPTEEELQKAEARRDKYYRRLITTAREKARLGKHVDITDIEHMAAEHFRLNESWHTVVEAPIDCPNCGEQIKAGVAYHKNSMDLICVLDWDRAIAAGAKKESDRPKPKNAA